MSDRLLVATRKGLFDLRRTKMGWKIQNTSFLGDHVSAVLRDPRDGSLYAGLNHGHFGCKMQRSDDDGKTWNEIGCPAYPEGEVIHAPEWNVDKQPKPASLELIWILEPGGDNQQDTIWAGTIPGGLFKSNDKGATWELVRPLWDREERKEWFGGGFDRPGIHSIYLRPGRPDHMTVGVSCGGVWRSNDAGKNWELLGSGLRAEYMPPERQGELAIQDPHRIAACASAPDTMWVQHHNGIFKSIDGANTWTEITNVKPSVFGFGVVVHPRKPDTAWFAPAIKDEKRIPVGGQLVITRTRDGGKTFEQLTSGLPQEHCYDLVFRHALDIDNNGDRLAFGSTTGSLFASDNQGDHWEHVSAHLPPIYAVRFA